MSSDGKTTERRVLEWGCRRMIEAKDTEQARKVWDSFPYLHKDWRFIALKNRKKNEFLK